MADSAEEQGTIRLHELAIPCSIESITAALMSSYIPKSSQLTMSTRTSGAYPNSSLDWTEVTLASIARLSMPEV